jgi:hypothetical protein
LRKTCSVGARDTIASVIRVGIRAVHGIRLIPSFLVSDDCRSRKNPKLSRTLPWRCEQLHTQRKKTKPSRTGCQVPQGFASGAEARLQRPRQGFGLPAIMLSAPCDSCDRVEGAFAQRAPDLARETIPILPIAGYHAFPWPGQTTGFEVGRAPPDRVTVTVMSKHMPVTPLWACLRAAARIVSLTLCGLGIALFLPPIIDGAAQKPSTASENAAQTGRHATTQAPQEATERAEVLGFRSARWGMTETQVKTAIQKDFNIAAEKVRVEENPSERTSVLNITVDELLESAGKAHVSYILGYSSKKLIQVNVAWGTAVDPQSRPERVVAAANQLLRLFLGSGYEPDTVVSNTPSRDGGIVVFQGQDADKHMTVLRLMSGKAPAAKQHRKDETRTSVALLLSYLQDARNPDVYRLKKGQF